ncbi:hypothetical protein RBU55_21520 [Pseudomonas chlororaphis subsp. aurantiaca]|uniref:hypothetical protein n=1 Tax=Pseudomonas chlororaphis TaxID=587753 RepID=UPI0027DD5E0A|nr:hypothetical protein [Pseudomonas chlororaphis]WMI98130.1 hypothetical protein RBU55_21520 [Pseudomonas chlororaphis subsp. aurantiaca]
MSSSSTPNLRNFFRNFDSGIINGLPAFLYIDRTDVNGDLPFLRHYVNSDEYRDIPLPPSAPGTRIHAASLVKDEANNVLAITWYHSGGASNHEAFFAHLVAEPTGIQVAKPIPLDFPNIISPLLVSLVPSGEHFYFACIDARTDGPWKFCLASLDTRTLEPTSRVTELDAEVCESYRDENLRQLGRNLTLVADTNGGAFLQFVNSHHNIAVYHVGPPQSGVVSHRHLFNLSAEQIGYHTAVFDPDYSTLVTCFGTITPVTKEQRIYGIASQIFGDTPSKKTLRPRHSVAPLQFRQLSLRPGSYYRPQISRIQNDAQEQSRYLVSWEGDASIDFSEFSADLDPTSIEYSLEATLPGNHRAIATDSLYGIAYQDDCSEPRQVGLQYHSQSISRQDS